MSDEVIQMCGEHKDGRGYCQRALNHVGLHLFPPMPPHIYNQEEADALIAGAVLAVVPCPYCVGQVEMVDGEHVWRESKYVISNTRPCPRHDALAKMPDAARLALEEREKQIRLEVIRKVNLLLGMKADADLESFDKAKTALAEREAKLTADTRLEESKFWWNVHRSLSHEGVSNCSMCEHHSSNIAALRAAVQEPQNET